MIDSAIKDIVRIIRFHMDRRQGFSARDAYKLLYQRCMGTEHMLHDINRARQCLISEIEQNYQHMEEILLEPLICDFSVLRVNLRPFHKFGYDPEKLLSAFVDSSKDMKSGKDDLMAAWEILLDSTRQGFLDLNIEDLNEVWSIAVKNDFPAMRHSESYRELNRPSYRVVSKNALLKYISDLNDEIIKTKESFQFD